MSKDIKVTGALVFPENVPTRAGEVVNSVGEIYDIPAPRVGMIVYDKSTGINYIVRSLKAKVIDGVRVDNAQVDEYEELEGRTKEEFLKRLQGVSKNSNASTDPFKFLGNLSKTIFFETIDALNGDSAASREECAGHFRAVVEHRIVDVYSEQIGWQNNVWVQRMVCPMQLFNEVVLKENVYTKKGVDKDGNAVSYTYRTHTYTQNFGTLTGVSTNQNTVKTYTRTCNNGVWGDWKDVSNNYINSPNYGKKMAFFGGSFAQNMSLTSTPWSFDYQGRTYSLMQYIAEKLGATSFDDYAVGSQGVIVGDIPIIEQLQTAGAGYDIYVIFGGINDFGNSTPLGESNGAADDTTYCGGLKKAFDWIRSKNKSAKIYTVTPFKAYTPDDRYWNPRSNIKKNGHTFYEFIQAQKEVAQIHGVPCFDLWANQQFSGASASEHYYTDLLHPNGKGYQAVADALVEFLAYGVGSGVLDAYAVLPTATETSKGLMSAGDKQKLQDVDSRLGHNAGTIVLKASDLIPMVWDATKMVSSTNFNVWIVPLSDGREYNAVKQSFIQSRRTCSEYPMLDKMLTMINITSSLFTATSEMKFLVVTVDMSVYDGSDYEISASGHGLMNEFNSLKTRVNETYELSKNTQNHLLQTESELSACIGSKDRTIILTSNDYDNLLWDGTAFVNANNIYNGFVVPIYPGERIRYTAPQANNVCTLTDYPTIGSSERVRTRTDFNGAYAKGDFIVQDNEHYLFLNTTVATHDSYEVVGGKGALNVQLDGLRELQNPLNGKTIVCFGDSLTEFNGIEGKGYGDYLAELSGAKVIRGGIGGTQLATRKEPVETIPDTDIAYQHAYGAVDISNLVKAWANNDWGIVDNAIAWLAENKNDNNSAVIERLKANPIENTDIVIVFGGTNDLNNSTFGSPNDTDPIKNTCGGINQIIDSILSVKPDMTIYFFTPIPRMATSEVWCDDYRTDQSDAHGSLSFPSLVKRIKECVEYNHIPCCDMYNTIGINRKNIYTYADDGVHPNHGYSMLANRMYGFIIANRNWR